MVSITQRLTVIREIGELALKGLSDEEIAKKLNESVFTVSDLRKGLGIYKYRPAVDITKDWKRAVIKEGSWSSQRVQFAINRMRLTDLGVNPDKQVEFTGKIVDKKLVLRFRNI